MTTFPVFHVQTGGIGEATGVVGTVTRTTHGGENWVGDGWVGFLKSGARLVYGRWHQRGELWEFAPENREAIGIIAARAEWEVLDGYWGARAEIVLDDTRHWEKAGFESTDAVRVQGTTGTWLKPRTDTGECGNRVMRLFPSASANDGENMSGPEVIKAAWNHEHCAICWETLGPGGQADGFVSSQQTWVCERCYVDFIQQRSLGFIPSA